MYLRFHDSITDICSNTFCCCFGTCPSISHTCEVWHTEARRGREGCPSRGGGAGLSAQSVTWTSKTLNTAKTLNVTAFRFVAELSCCWLLTINNQPMFWFKIYILNKTHKKPPLWPYVWTSLQFTIELLLPQRLTTSSEVIDEGLDCSLSSE